MDMLSKKTLVFISLLISLLCKSALAWDIVSPNSDGKSIYYYYINNNTELAVTKSNSEFYIGDIIIPEEVNNLGKIFKVTCIGANAFLDCKQLTSVTLPKSITSIELNAFSGCTNLTSIIIPENVNSIGENAFNFCIGLTSIGVDAGNKTFDSRDNCNAIIETSTNTLVRGCKTTTIPNSISNIGERAFENCTSLTSLSIPNSITNISFAAFYNCSGLESVTIPNSVNNIGNYSFYGCTNLTTIIIPNSVNSIGNAAFLESGLTIISSKIIDPFAISSDTFSSNSFYFGKLIVPEGTIEKYKSQSGWNYFLNIEEENSTRIENSNNNGINILRRCTLAGKNINQPQKGINIIQTDDGNIKKILVK